MFFVFLWVAFGSREVLYIMTGVTGGEESELRVLGMYSLFLKCFFLLKALQRR